MKKTSESKQQRYIVTPVIRGTVLGVTVYRGYARLCDLARVTKPDIYDQQLNPTGTQRDLSPPHARAAYEYVAESVFAFWPEVFLCIRIPDSVEYIPSRESPDIGVLRIDCELAAQSDRIAISRVDGNHRLHYADGSEKGFSPIERQVSFCMAPNLTQEQEITLFRDINDNQRRMNTSHLDNIEARLTPEERLMKEDPALYIAQRLGRDQVSPLHGRVYEGGKKPRGLLIPLRSLKSGIKYMFSRSTRLTALDQAESQYKVICNYLSAVRAWQSQAWNDPSSYLLRGAGLWGICFIGADVIDRAMRQGKFDTQTMLSILQSGRDWDWSRRGPFRGLGGRGGAFEISKRVTAEFEEDSAVSVNRLREMILKD